MGDDSTTSTSNEVVNKKQRVLKLLREAAAEVAREDDPWVKYNIPTLCPAERVIRHLYNPETGIWTTDETIVKIEKEPFTHGAMRFCYRMKKRAQPPSSATNHRFHKHGWVHASNYIAKAYIKDGTIDTSDKAKDDVKNDVLLQYEAQYWAYKFNNANPPTKIHFIRAYAIEFPNRPGKPWFAVERYIAGKDLYGAGFTKHNTNAGYVDTELRRVTPQLFSAYSFYISHGQRLVADIQGVGDLYTDPQILSNDYRFGDGDLGPRGMALFFHSFRSCSASDSMGIPIFPLSKNEIKQQEKYEEDEITLSDDELSKDGVIMDAFQLLDINRQRRISMLHSPPQDLLPPDKKDTYRRSNISLRAVVSEQVRTTIAKTTTSPQRKTGRSIHRTKSDIDEVQACLDRARRDRVYTNHDFHRYASGELRERQYKDNSSNNNVSEKPFHRSSVVRQVSSPIIPNDETRMNLGRVHYQLAVLHGSGRFPDDVPREEGQNHADLPAHDVFSVLFHLSYSASLKNAPACLALARVQAGFDTYVSDLLPNIVSTDFEAAKILLRRAMTSPHPPTKPKAAAGCLLFQILHDESDLFNGEKTGTEVVGYQREMIEVLEGTRKLFDELEKEDSDVKIHQARVERGGGLHAGDRVEADYFLEGTYYPAVVESVDGENVTVRYDDDGSVETLPKQHIRVAIPATATQTSLGGPLSDEEAFGSAIEADDSFLLTKYELLFDLAELKEKVGNIDEASTLYEHAADSAMSAGKMKTATAWSLKAAELRA